MADYDIDVTILHLEIDGHFDRLTRSNDPQLSKMLEDEVIRRTKGSTQKCHFNLSEEQLRQYALTYGEQFVSDPCADLDQYFDIINGRLFSRNIPTRLAVLYLFGSGKQYKASDGALSAAGEAVAGYCLEQFGYKPLVRPLGVMPDAVLWTTRSGKLHLALAEAKASTTQEVRRLLQKNVSQFFVDVKTRATGFRFGYEVYLTCIQFKDGRGVNCVILRSDLGYYSRGQGFISGSDTTIGSSFTVGAYDEPERRLQSIIRLQAETCAAKDEYLTSLLSEEASRSATLALIRQETPPESSTQVEGYVNRTAVEMGLEDQWLKGQDLIKHTKRAEEGTVRTAIQRFSKPVATLDN